MVNPSEYNIGVPAEDLSLYRPGGYHPVHIGDRLSDRGRYEILNKAGFGSFSTVWLARDHWKNMNVSIKIIRADHGRNYREGATLSWISHTAKSNTKNPGSKYIVQYLDQFKHQGPNGQHVCIVQELLGPTVSTVAENSPGYRLDGNLARRVSRQLLLCLDFLHSLGVVHGDIHPRNILFRLSDQARSKNIPALCNPEIGKVSRKDGHRLEKGLPEYLVQPMEYDEDYIEEIQLIDFGEAFLFENRERVTIAFSRWQWDPHRNMYFCCRTNEQGLVDYLFEDGKSILVSNTSQTVESQDSLLDHIYTPLSSHPPELVFKHRLGQEVDIWNLGCTTYELVTGRKLFEADFDNRSLIPQFEEVLGNLPTKWLLDALAHGVLKDGPKPFPSANGFLPLEKELDRSYFVSDSNTLPLNKEMIETLAHYLRRMLVVDPKGRATTRELLDNEKWVADD